MKRLRSIRHTRLVMLILALAMPAAQTRAQRDVPLGVAIVSRAVQPGEVVRFDVTCRCRDAVPRIAVLGRDAKPYPDPSSDGTAWHALVGIDLDTAAGVYPVTVTVDGLQGPSTVTLDLRVAAKAFPTRQLRVAPRFVEPSAAELDRIVREAARLDALLAGLTPRRWDAPFVAPVTGARASSNFGARSVFNGQPRSPHGGVDFGSPVGTPVVAPAAGRVVLAEDLFFTGNTVVIDHGLGLFSLLAHLSAIGVAVDDAVGGGQMVGRVGATGRVTGPHLHWSVRLDGARVDPLSLLSVTSMRAETRPVR